MICEHGSLKRSCPHCELSDYIKDLNASEAARRTEQAWRLQAEFKLELAIKALELLANGNNSFPTWGDTVDVLIDVRSVAKETLEEIKRLGEGVNK